MQRRERRRDVRLEAEAEHRRWRHHHLQLRPTSASCASLKAQTSALARAATAAPRASTDGCAATTTLRLPQLRVAHVAYSLDEVNLAHRLDPINDRTAHRDRFEWSWKIPKSACLSAPDDGHNK
jgi:hypothetical protein